MFALGVTNCQSNTLDDVTAANILLGEVKKHKSLQWEIYDYFYSGCSKKFQQIDILHEELRNTIDLSEAIVLSISFQINPSQSNSQLFQSTKKVLKDLLSIQQQIFNHLSTLNKFEAYYFSLQHFEEYTANTSTHLMVCCIC